MMKMNKILVLFLLVLSVSCNKQLDPASYQILEDSQYTGNFKALNSGLVGGYVSLKVSKGYYECTTNFPYGTGAGKLEAQGNKINFIDTLFFPIPAIYGPSFVLSGEYCYMFDGAKLQLWKEYGNEILFYELETEENN
jgi:hypothetical protein